jgi:hypothetical protein
MLFSSAHNAIEDLSKRLLKHPQAVAPTAADDALDCQRLQGIIDELRSELGTPLTPLCFRVHV